MNDLIDAYTVKCGRDDCQTTFENGSNVAVDVWDAAVLQGWTEARVPQSPTSTSHYEPRCPAHG